MNNRQIAKRIALTIAWFLLVLFVVTALMGCATNKPNLEPLPPEKLFDNLLHEDSLQNIAYKSITIEDIVIKEYCG